MTVVCSYSEIAGTHDRLGPAGVVVLSTYTSVPGGTPGGRYSVCFIVNVQWGEQATAKDRTMPSDQDLEIRES